MEKIFLNLVGGFGFKRWFIGGMFSQGGLY
jgi:hypothetical protein